MKDEYFVCLVSSPTTEAVLWLINAVYHSSIDEYNANNKTKKQLVNELAELRQRITEQEQLARREKLAILDQLAGGMGHELRNILGVIKNIVYFLKTVLEEPEPNVKKCLEILEKEVARSESIIGSLFNFTRPKPPTRQKVDINHIVQEALFHTFQVYDRRSETTVPENVKVVSQLDESLPAVMADPDQLSQVFGNIILNAIQAMPEGGQLVVKSEAQGPEWIAVTFADTGVGIPEENLGKIFEPLFTSKARGIGLGLAVTRTLVEGHGGTIDVVSEVGKGSTFTVRLPI